MWTPAGFVGGQHRKTLTTSLFFVCSIVHAVRLSRATSRIIRQNLIASLAIVVLLVIATFIGLNIGAVVLIHEGSTLIVVANALRLLGFERGKEHAGIDHEDRPSH